MTTLLIEKWEQASGRIAELGDAFPEEKFEWQPVPAIRTCGGVLRHVAFWNQYVADCLHNKEADDSLNELPLADCPTKAKMMEVLRRSSQDVSSALRDQDGVPNQKTVELVMTFVEHTAEHYGQLAVYGRLIGIVPPASGA